MTRKLARALVSGHLSADLYGPTVVGTTIRILVVMAWLAMFAWHVVQFALPAFGVRRGGGDPTAMLARQIDRQLEYAVHTSGAGRPRIGHCHVGAAREEALIRVDTTLDLAVLPGGLTASLPWLGTSGRGLKIAAVQRFDEQARLRSVAVDGQLLGLELTFAGTVDQHGLHGRLSIAGTEQEIQIVSLDSDHNQGLGLGLHLPEGLQPGDRFHTRTLDVGMDLTPRESIAVYEVLRSEPCQTAGGLRELLCVTMHKDRRLAATAWCDETGLVYRSQIADGTLDLELMTVTDGAGQRLWPTEVTP